MHDVGRFGLLAGCGKAYATLLASGFDTPAALLEAERENFGFDHCEAGARLEETWRLPGELAEATAAHHLELPQASTLATLVRAACRLAFGIRLSDDPLPGGAGAGGDCRRASRPPAPARQPAASTAGKILLPGPGLRRPICARNWTAYTPARAPCSGDPLAQSVSAGGAARTARKLTVPSRCAPPALWLSDAARLVSRHSRSLRRGSAGCSRNRRRPDAGVRARAAGGIHGATAPDSAGLAVLDAVTLPGPEFLIEARTISPRCHLVLWAEEVTIKIVRQAFEFGARGVISGKSAPASLVAALLRIARGELYFPDLYCTPGELAGTALGPRERELVALIAQGLKNKEIATMMHLTEGTVKVYLTRLYQRLNVTDRFELALFGLGAFSATGANRSGRVSQRRRFIRRRSVRHCGGRAV